MNTLNLDRFTTTELYLIYLETALQYLHSEIRRVFCFGAYSRAQSPDTLNKGQCVYYRATDLLQVVIFIIS